MKDLFKLSEPIRKICLIFLSWRILLIVIAIFAIYFFPLAFDNRFLGGGLSNYKLAPYFFAWANFDGDHYLSIAIYGYKGLEQVFFPIFPKLISFLARPFFNGVESSLVFSTLIGLIISNASFILALIYLYDLIKIDFSKKLTLLVILLLTFFPTSFYFGALYNESLFLLLTVLAFLNARKGRWFLAAIFGMIASATRVFGILLFPAFIIEVFLQRKIKGSYWLLLIPLGLIIYMYYQYLTVGDPLAFYNLQDLVGEQRQSKLVFFPQVYFRYLKMITQVNPAQSIYQTIILEFIAGILFFVLPLYGYFKKIRLSYLFYAFTSYLITTVQGSFSSLPRYGLVFFPSFIALAIFVDKFPKLLKIIFFILLTSVLIIETVLFTRGYWVA